MDNADMDDLGGGYTNDLGSYSSLATFTTTSPKTSASFVSTSLLTIRASLLSLSDKSTGDVIGNIDVDCATGSFCSSYSGCWSGMCYVLLRPRLLGVIKSWGLSER